MADFTPQRDVLVVSHLNVVVADIDVATEFYGTALGFERATNAAGPMDYPGVDLASFARNAGFGDGPLSLDVRFLKHPEVSRYLELFRYRYPEGDQSIHRRKTNDLGGIRHVALEVPDAVAAYAFIRSQQEAYAKRACTSTSWAALITFPRRSPRTPTSSSTGSIPGACSGSSRKAAR
jgi:catechol 2,3-dioxygenase-like lactoylglutathione lyase family enzyme